MVIFGQYNMGDVPFRDVFIHPVIQDGKVTELSDRELAVLRSLASGAVESRAEITLLHVVSPVELDYPTARAELDHWQSLAETDTPVGRSLRLAMESAEAANLKTIVKGRRGKVVEEILAEIKSGGYDLVCMGSPFSGNALRQLYAPNVTAEVSEGSGCPVITARFKREE